jgi:chorismate mutase
MSAAKKSKYYLVEASMLPEIFLKVMEAKELLETGEAGTVAEATNQVGISRSTFYKYKDSISQFQDMKRGHIITFHIMLRDRMGILSSVLSIFADTGANILTINQSIPSNGTAVVTISAETSDMEMSTEELLARVEAAEGVIKLEVLAG